MSSTHQPNPSASGYGSGSGAAGGMMLQGPPYVLPVATLGGRPTVDLDVPISAVFLALFVLGAVGHMTVFQLNRQRAHKFIPSAALFGFCMARIATLTMRIVWAVHIDNASLAIAASVLTAAGVVVLFVVNLIFTQRVVRARHPQVGWHPWFGRVFVIFYVVLGVSLALLVGLTVTTFFTLDTHLRSVARDIQLYGQSAFLLLCFLPLPILAIAYAIPRRQPVERFGSGNFHVKPSLLVFTTTLLTLGAAFRLGTNALPARPITDPAWYQSKPCFYLFNFTIEIIVIYTYLLARVDRRFHVPDGSKGPGDYARGHPDKQASVASQEDKSLEAENTV